MRRNPTGDQPTEETPNTVGAVGGKPLRLQIEAPLGAIKHCLCRFDLIVDSGWRRLNVYNGGVLDIDEIVEPVAELHALVGFCRPGQTRITRRNYLRRLAVRVGLALSASAVRYSLTARVWRSGSAHSISFGALPW
jgi:hypothetical protein